MLNTVEELKNKRPDLVELFEGMTHEQLLEQIYKEVVDAVNMKERVQTFMDETTNLSKTTYTPEAIKGFVENKIRTEISDFCKVTLEDTRLMDGDEIRNYLKEEIID